MRYAIVACIVGLWFSPVRSVEAADGPSLDVSGGFAVLSPGAPCCLPTTYTTPTGWNTGLAVNLRAWVAIAGTIGGDYQTVTVDFRGTPALHARTYTFLAGPRFTKRLGRNFDVFGQVLLGATHRQARISGAGALLSSLVGDVSANHFAWQPGGGVELGISRRWAVRLEGDYRVTPIDAVVFTVVRAQARFLPSLVFTP